MSDTNRRSLLKGTAGILATGLFPAVHAQEKVVLRYLGTAVNQDKSIAAKFKADTGISRQALETAQHQAATDAAQLALAQRKARNLRHFIFPRVYAPFAITLAPKRQISNLINFMRRLPNISRKV